MELDFAEDRVPIKLGKNDLTMVMNFNTMKAYERVSGKLYFDSLLNLNTLYIEEMKKALLAGKATMSYMGIARRVSATDLGQMLWASLHTYEGKKPIWRLTEEEVYRLIKPHEMPRILKAVLEAHSANSPNKEELGEADSAANEQGKPLAEVVQMPPASGGEQSSELFADAFV